MKRRWPPVLILFLAVLAIIPVVASAALHWVARFGKEDIAQRMAAENWFPGTIAKVQDVTGGAFRPLWQDPVVEAMLVPIALLTITLVLVQWTPVF